ncbi:MAG: acyl-CoA dehydrogenase [Gammaproteobacteria bacterium]|nr:acyl-CoA dehydrogenase [Gammaproteobacteria bacterium]
MNFLFLSFAIIAGGGLLAYLKAPLSIATAASGIGLLVLSNVGQGVLSGLLMVAAWLTWAVMLLLNFGDLRRRYLTAPVLAFFRKSLPTMSQTERDALDAGTVWWDAELFSGAPDWRRLLDLPAKALSDEEQAFIDGPVTELCAMVNEWEISRELGDLPASAWDYIKTSGILGIIIPKKYGGLGFSAHAHSEIMMKLATRSGTAAVSCMVPNSLGPAELLMRYGTEEQKDHYLPRLARGEEIPCFALTNPYAGSDAANIPDFGIVCEGEHDGRTVLGMRVTWEKRYITLGPVASLLGLAFHLYDPDGLLGEDEDVGITLALIPTDHPGVEIGRRHYPARQAFQNGPNSGRDVFMPMEWIIGGQARCGDGWRMLMNCLAVGRSISLPASSAGVLKVCARTTGAYARVRQQFNVPLSRFEGVQEAMARIAANTYLIDAARNVTAGALDIGEEPSVLSAVLKYQATERMRASVNDAMDVHGGRAICDGPSNYLFHPYMAAPVAITVEGANILTRSLIIFGQGAVRCHPWLLEEMNAAALDDPDDALARFDNAFMGHVGHILTNLARAAFRNLTGGKLGSAPSVGEVNYWYAQLERASASFAVIADATLAQLGGALKRREMLSGRFADVLGELYLLSCALKHFEDGGRSAAELPLLEFAMRDGLYTVQSRLDEILQNLPVRSVAWGLRRVVFPWGRRWRRPNDELTTSVANLLAESREVRDRLSFGMYLVDSESDPIGCLEYALRTTEQCEALSERVREAIKSDTFRAYGVDVPTAALEAGVISETEAEQLRVLEKAIRRAIDVDDFDSAELWAVAAEADRTADAA